MNEESLPDHSLSADHLLAVEELRKRAEQGNAEAQFRLGSLYGNGEGVPLDHDRAMTLFMQACKQGHENACVTIAWMYATGAGVAVDEDKARELYLMTARHGSAKAQYVVATMYRFGQYGTEPDLQQALHWYQQAADQGSAPAQLALGKLAQEGKLVARDQEAALQWFMLAQVNGSKRAQDYIKPLMEQMPADRVAQVRERMLGRDSS